MTKKQIKEASGVLGAVTGAHRFKVRIIAQGRGSSGFYSESALKETGPMAFPAGTHMHLDHQTRNAMWDQPEGSVKDLVGVLATDAAYEEDADGVAGLYAEAEFDDSVAPFIEKFGKFLGLSIAASGLVDGETEDGYPIIAALVPSPLNRVDVVTAAGANGAFIEAIESYRNRDTIAHESSTYRKDDGMKPEDIEAVAAAVAEALKPSFAAISEAITPATTTEDEAPATEAVTEALIEADLPKAARAKVYAAVASGVDLTEAISTEKAYIEDVRKGFAPEDANVGVLHESAKTDAPSVMTVAGW